MLTKQHILDSLSEVLDPELNISIVDLGLVYDVQIHKSGEVNIVMTLTTIGCPLFNLIEQEVQSQLHSLGVPDDKITIDLTFDPPWSTERMSESAKAMLGI